MKTTEQIKGRRTRTFFTWFPVSIYSRDKLVTRWLEKVTLEEEYIEECVSPIGEFFSGYWEPIRFVKN